MAVKDQCDFFKTVYDDEIARLGRLSGRANLYFTIISFFLGAIVFNFDNLKKFLFLFSIPMWTYLVVALALTTALIATLWAVTIRSYQGICDAEALAESLDNRPVEDGLREDDGDFWIDDDVFWKDRIAVYAKATTVAAAQNQRVANTLRVAAYGLVLAASVQGIILLAALVIKIVSYNTPHQVASPVRSAECDNMKENTTKPAPPKAAAPPQTKQAAKTMVSRLRDVPEIRRDESDNSD